MGNQKRVADQIGVSRRSKTKVGGTGVPKAFLPKPYAGGATRSGMMAGPMPKPMFHRDTAISAAMEGGKRKTGALGRIR